VSLYLTAVVGTRVVSAGPLPASCPVARGSRGQRTCKIQPCRSGNTHERPYPRKIVDLWAPRAAT